MTPKEKSKLLIERFWHLDEECEISDGFEFGRKCALITVDEILITLDNGHNNKYWEDVKHEIIIL